MVSSIGLSGGNRGIIGVLSGVNRGGIGVDIAGKICYNEGTIELRLPTPASLPIPRRAIALPTPPCIAVQHANAFTRN